MKFKSYVLPTASFCRPFVVAVVCAVTAVVASGAPPVGGPAAGAAGNLGLGAGLGAGNAAFGAQGAGGIGVPARGIGSAPGGSALGGAGHAGASFDDFESIGMRQDRIRAQAGATGPADAHASVMGEARGRSVATVVAGGAAASLNRAATMQTIQQQAMESRAQLLAELHTRVDASEKAMASVRQSGAKLHGEAKAHFGTASSEVKVREKALQQSLKAAEKADAKGWATARAKLAGDYRAYASAVARAEASSQAGAKSADQPKG
jgi:hypothetical protein